MTDQTELVDELTVRLADVGPGGRIHLEAIARYLQDLAHDHMLAVGLIGAGGWVLRRVGLSIGALPGFGERLHAVTTCTSAGARCADRVTRLIGHRGAELRACAVWIHVDPDTGRSRRLPEAFYDCFPLPEERRRLSTKLHHRRPASGATLRPWPTRASDFDINGHMNNAAFWAPVDDAVAAFDGARVRRVELEYRAAIQPGDAVTVALANGPDRLDLWLLVGEEVRGSARVVLGPNG